MDPLTGFRLVWVLQMLQHMFNSYGVIDKIDTEENMVKIMVPYDPAETLDRLINQLKKGPEFAKLGGHTRKSVGFS